MLMNRQNKHIVKKASDTAFKHYTSHLACSLNSFHLLLENDADASDEPIDLIDFNIC